MSLSKNKCWYSNNCLHFLKRAIPTWRDLLFSKVKVCLHTLFYSPSFKSKVTWKGIILLKSLNIIVLKDRTCKGSLEGKIQH